MRTELVALLDPAPAVIDRHRPLVARANAGAPVIGVGVAAAGPANDRHVKPLQRLDNIAAVAADVRDGRILTDPDAGLDALPQLLGELPVDLRCDPDSGC